MARLVELESHPVSTAIPFIKGGARTGAEWPRSPKVQLSLRFHAAAHAKVLRIPATELTNYKLLQDRMA